MNQNKKWKSIEKMATITTICLLFGSITIVCYGIILLSNPDNFIVTNTTELKLKKVELVEENKTSKTYAYAARIGPYRMHDQITISDEISNQKMVKFVLLTEDEIPRLEIKTFELKNNFYNKWATKYNPKRQYTFYVDKNMTRKKEEK